MSDDVKLSENEPINLDGQPLDEGIELPKSEDDFDLDTFLAENAVGDTSDVDLNFAQEATDLSGLFDDKEEVGETGVSLDDLPEIGDEKKEPESEATFLAEPEIETVSEDVPEVENEKDISAEEVSEIQNEYISEPEDETPLDEEVVSDEEKGTFTEDNSEDEAEPVDDGVEASFDEATEHTEEDVVNGNVSKGWAFEGIEEDVVGSEKTEALNMNDEETAPSFEEATVEENMPEAALAEEVAEEPLVDEDVVESSVETNIEADGNVDADYEQEPTDVGTAGLNKSQAVYDVPEINGYARWYSGNYDEEAFEVDKQSVSAVLDGDDIHKTIHVNVGYDTYGWQVEFANGVVMNLRDVREYQLKNGALPAKDGAVVYGDMRVEFHHIEKITLYENVRYFTYMPN